MNQNLTHQIHRENLWLRELLRKVSADLEHVAGVQTEAGHRDLLERRAMRIRQRLFEGPPAEWAPRYGG